MEDGEAEELRDVVEPSYAKDSRVTSAPDSSYAKDARVTYGTNFASATTIRSGRNFIISIYNKMPTTENTTSNAGGGVTIVKKPIPRKYQTFSFRRLLGRSGGTS